MPRWNTPTSFISSEFCCTRISLCTELFVGCSPAYHEVWDKLDNLVNRHAWSPLLAQYLLKHITTICERWVTELGAEGEAGKLKNAYFCLADDLRCLEWETVGDNDVEEELLDLVVKELRLYDLRADLDLPKESAKRAVNRA